MVKKEKISLNLDVELLSMLRQEQGKARFSSLTEVITQLLYDGFNLRKEVYTLNNVLELTQLKSLFYMREIMKQNENIAAGVTPKTLNEIDDKFTEKLDDLKQMIIKQGIDYYEI